MSESPSILARELEFAYRSKRPAPRPFVLRFPRWEVARGSRVALTGPSGSGKSTLLNLVAGVLAPTGGALEVEGRDLARLSDAERRAHRIRTMGFVFQDFPLLEYLDAEQNVLLPYRLNPALSEDGSLAGRLRGLLDELGLADKGRRKPSDLSQGERQRIAIARALITDPDLLLADEPTAGLDPARGAAVMDMLERLSERRGLTLLLATHDPTILARFSTVINVGDLAGDAQDGS